MVNILFDEKLQVSKNLHIEHVIIYTVKIINETIRILFTDTCS